MPPLPTSSKTSRSLASLCEAASCSFSAWMSATHARGWQIKNGLETNVDREQPGGAGPQW
eukprot:scaffold88631_cov21-Tisochrysis_lutea.AAC.1